MESVNRIRNHRRVRLTLPVRIRWSGPFGQREEFCESRDASRSGLLLNSRLPHSAGALLWITFPFDASLPGGQPEMLARIVRVEPPCAGLPGAIALQFESLPAEPVHGNGSHPHPERRSSPRRVLALPVRLRPANVPWFEEAMTIDVSLQGLRILGHREYAIGERLLVSFDPPQASPWHSTREIPVRVARAGSLAGSPALIIAVQRIQELPPSI